MWWTVPPEHRVEFEHWHVHEHFPERMGVPGFRRGSRWVSPDGAGSVFTLYELDAPETLTSEAYLARVNKPTPWSARMMPYHGGMVRSPVRVIESHGWGIAGFVVTVRFSPRAGAERSLEEGLCGLLQGLSQRPGLTGAHLLRTEMPQSDSLTAEQKLRGGDRAADWIVIAAGYDPEALAAVSADELRPAAITRLGAEPPPLIQTFRLSFALTPGEGAFSLSPR
jgi:hypothetical protein